MTKYKFILQKKSNKARAGIIKTSLGDIKTPAFMPVATQGAIKSTPINIIEDMGYEMILSNTYHNLFFYLSMVKDARDAIIRGKFSEFKKSFLKKYKSGID